MTQRSHPDFPAWTSLSWRSFSWRYGVLIGCVVLIIGTGLGFVAYHQLNQGPVIHPTPVVRYLGVHEPTAPNTYTGVNQFAQNIGRQPNLVAYYSPWGYPFQPQFAAQAAQHGAITLIQMDPKDVTLASIAAGRQDAYLRGYAAAVKAFGSRVVVSFAHEMNGNWYPWGNQHTPAATFVAAWRHVVNVFRATGASNVIWLWQVNIIDNSDPVHIPGPSPWWPGKSYVTWVGIDGYYYKSSSSFAEVFGPTVVAVRELTAAPILIAETGADPAADQPAKVSDLFSGVRSYGLLGFVWFDEIAQGHAWRITSPAAFAAFRRGARAFVRSSPIPAAQRSG
jgi:hypothetical protein